MWKENPQVQKFMRQGYEAWQAGNLTEAMDYYQNALELNPRQTDALNSLGVIYEQVGLPDKAEEKYLSAIKLNYKYLAAYSNLGFLYWNQGNLEKSAYYFKKRVELGNPKDPWTIKAQRALDAVKKSTHVVDRDLDVNQTLDQMSK